MVYAHLLKLGIERGIGAIRPRYRSKVWGTRKLRNWREMVRGVPVVIALIASSAASATEPVTIGVLQFQAADQVPKNIATAIEQFVYSKFTGQQRFVVLERSRLDAVQAERVVQEIQNVAEKTSLSDLGADYVVLGEVTQASVGRQTLSNGGTVYRATLSFGLRIIDVATGTVSFSSSFTNGRGNMFSGALAGFRGNQGTPAGAIDIALQETSKEVDAFLATAFSVSGRVVSVESTDRKGNPATLLVSLGAADGVRRGTKLTAFVTQQLEVDGRSMERKRPVAELTFVQAEGDHLSLFRVGREQSGLAAALEAGNVSVEVAP